MFRRPFVYFSEAIITPTKSLSIITNTVDKYGGTLVLPVQDIWTQSATSVKRQAALYRHKGFKGESWHHWLTDTVDMIANSVQFEEEGIRGPFRSDLMRTLGKPSSYYVPDESRRFVEELAEAGIGWGIVANENHMYQAVLKLLRLSPPGPVVSATGPTMFKPLPSMWSRAVARAPAQSKHDIWFVGSALNPCDNMAKNDSIKCALVAPQLSQPDPASQHFRITCLDDLKPSLIGSRSQLFIPNFEELEELPPHEDHKSDVVLRTTNNPLLNREGQEPSLADIKDKVKSLQ